MAAVVCTGVAVSTAVPHTLAAAAVAVAAAGTSSLLRQARRWQPRATLKPTVRQGTKPLLLQTQTASNHSTRGVLGGKYITLLCDGSFTCRSLLRLKGPVCCAVLCCAVPCRAVLCCHQAPPTATATTAITSATTTLRNYPPLQQQQRTNKQTIKHTHILYPTPILSYFLNAIFMRCSETETTTVDTTEKWNNPHRLKEFC